VAVTAAQAGMTARCDCGAEVPVPSLSRLRQLGGQDAYESGPLDTIRRMIQSGELPAGPTCALSRKPTDDVLELEIKLPQFHKNRDAGNSLVILALVAGIWGVLYHALFGRSAYLEDERSIAIQVPLRVAAARQSRVRAMSQRRLWRLLRTVPVYARLLDENPEARISVCGRLT
jgi:hypothetical protein